MYRTLAFHEKSSKFLYIETMILYGKLSQNPAGWHLKIAGMYGCLFTKYYIYNIYYIKIYMVMIGLDPSPHGISCLKIGVLTEAKHGFKQQKRLFNPAKAWSQERETGF